MSAPQTGAVLVVETGPDGRQALGPLLPGAPSPCLDCLLQRRRASERALGTWRLMPLDATQFERLRDARLWGRRLSPEGVAERLLCCRPWGQSCPLDGYLGAALLPDDAVGPCLGLIAQVHTERWVAGHVTCTARGSGAVGGAGLALHAHGTATASDPKRAYRLAVFEALEHHAAGVWQAADLAHEAPAQGRVLGSGPWVRAQGLVTGEPVWVPAGRVYMPFPDGQGGYQGHSDGLACGLSVHDARRRAVAELLERRVVDRLWSHLAPWAVADALCSRQTDAGVERIWQGVIARPMGHSVALCLQASEAGPPYGWVGFGCDADDTSALAKAQREAVHVLAHMRRLVARPDGLHALEAHAALSTMDRRVLALAFEPGLAQRWLLCLRAWAMQWDAPDPVPEESAGGYARHLAWRDITPPDVRRLGLSVVRAVWLDLSPD